MKFISAVVCLGALADGSHLHPNYGFEGSFIATSARSQAPSFSSDQKVPTADKDQFADTPVLEDDPAETSQEGKPTQEALYVEDPNDPAVENLDFERLEKKRDLAAFKAKKHTHAQAAEASADDSHGDSSPRLKASKHKAKREKVAVEEEEQQEEEQEEEEEEEEPGADEEEQEDDYDGEEADPADGDGEEEEDLSSQLKRLEALKAKFKAKKRNHRKHIDAEEEDEGGEEKEAPRTHKASKKPAPDDISSIKSLLEQMVSLKQPEALAAEQTANGKTDGSLPALKQVPGVSGYILGPTVSAEGPEGPATPIGNSPAALRYVLGEQQTQNDKLALLDREMKLALQSSQANNEALGQMLAKLNSITSTVGTMYAQQQEDQRFRQGPHRRRHHRDDNEDPPKDQDDYNDAEDEGDYDDYGLPLAPRYAPRYQQQPPAWPAMPAYSSAVPAAPGAMPALPLAPGQQQFGQQQFGQQQQLGQVGAVNGQASISSLLADLGAPASSRLQQIPLAGLPQQQPQALPSVLSPPPLSPLDQLAALQQPRLAAAQLPLPPQQSPLPLV